MNDLVNKVQAPREACLLVCKDAVFGENATQIVVGDPGRYPGDPSESQPDTKDILLSSLQLW